MAPGNRSRESSPQGSVHILDLHDLNTSEDAQMNANDLLLYAEALSGQTIHKGGGVVHLTAEEWLSRWRQFREARPEYHSFERLER